MYADSSFLVSLYVNDRHSSESRQGVLAALRLWLTPLHRAEWAHAIAQHVFRGKFGPAEAQQLHRQPEDDQSEGLWLAADVPEKAFDLCADLAVTASP